MIESLALEPLPVACGRCCVGAPPKSCSANGGGLVTEELLLLLLLPEEELLSLGEEAVDGTGRPVRRSTEGWGDDFLEEGLEEEPVSSDIRLEPLALPVEEEEEEEEEEAVEGVGLGIWGDGERPDGRGIEICNNITLITKISFTHHSQRVVQSRNTQHISVNDQQVVVQSDISVNDTKSQWFNK